MTEWVNERMRKAFTLVELMVVMAIIAILASLVFVSVKGSMAEARARRAEALCRSVQAGLTAYHAQFDKWPEPLGGYVESGNLSTASNNEGLDGVSSDSSKLVLSAMDVRSLVKALVDEAKKGNPLLDVSALFVSRDPGEKNGTGYGLDFISAVRGTNRSRKKMTTSEMYFGYPDRETGRFRRFKMVYSVPGDSLAVSTQ